MSAGPAELEFFRKKVPIDGAYSPTVVVPFPSQSPTIGIQPLPAGPYGKVKSAGPAEFVFLRKKVLVAGSYKPTVSVPSPFQSPARGSQPSPPGPYGNITSATPVLLEFRRKKKPLDGTYNPGVSSFVLPLAWWTVNVNPAIVIVPVRGSPVLFC